MMMQGIAMWLMMISTMKLMWNFLTLSNACEEDYADDGHVDNVYDDVDVAETASVKNMYLLSRAES